MFDADAPHPVTVAVASSTVSKATFRMAGVWQGEGLDERYVPYPVGALQAGLVSPQVAGRSSSWLRPRPPQPG